MAVIKYKIKTHPNTKVLALYLILNMCKINYKRYLGIISGEIHYSLFIKLRPIFEEMVSI